MQEMLGKDVVGPVRQEHLYWTPSLFGVSRAMALAFRSGMGGSEFGNNSDQHKPLAKLGQS